MAEKIKDRFAYAFSVSANMIRVQKQTNFPQYCLENFDVDQIGKRAVFIGISCQAGR